MVEYSFKSMPAAAELAVIDGGKLAPNAFQSIAIQLTEHYAGACRQLLDDATPGVDDHAVTVSFTATGMKAALSGSHRVAEVLYGAGSQQGLPMGLAGDGGKGGG